MIHKMNISNRFFIFHIFKVQYKSSQFTIMHKIRFYFLLYIFCTLLIQSTTLVPASRSRKSTQQKEKKILNVCAFIQKWSDPITRYTLITLMRRLRKRVSWVFEYVTYGVSIVCDI